MITLEQARESSNQNPYHQKCGFVIQEIGEGRCLMSVDVPKDALNRWEIVHGGFLYSLCDSAAGMAVMSLEKEHYVTLSSSMYFYKPAQCAPIEAEAKVVKDGRTIAVVKVVITQDERKIAEGNVEYYCS